jgi:hypothetical protein
VINPALVLKKKLIFKKAYEKIDVRALIGAEIAVRELNVRERAQVQQERKQLAANHAQGHRPAVQATHFGLRDIAVKTGRQDEIIIIPGTPPPTDEKENLPARLEEEDPYVLPASTAPALLQTNSKPKRACWLTLDYKVKVSRLCLNVARRPNRYTD